MRDATITLRMQSDLLNAVMSVAAQDERTVSAYVSVLLRKHLAERGIDIPLPAPGTTRQRRRPRSRPVEAAE